MSLWGLTTRSRTLRKWWCRDSQLKGVDWEGTEGNRTPCRTGRCGSHGPGRSGAHAVRRVTPASALADPIRAWRPHIADASPVLGELVICQSACKHSLGETIWALQAIDERTCLSWLHDGCLVGVGVRGRGIGECMPQEKSETQRRVRLGGRRPFWQSKSRLSGPEGRRCVPRSVAPGPEKWARTMAPIPGGGFPVLKSPRLTG